MDVLCEIRACYDAGRVLPGLAYRDPDVYEAEVAQIFRTGWISVACGQNVPNSGDLFPIRIAGQSLFVSRDEGDRVRVFYNMCRHRGARLVDQPCHARGGRIVCPYHAWTYALDGRLKSVLRLRGGTKNGPPGPQEAAAGTDRPGLIPVRSAVWRDIVFVNLSGDAQPFDEFIRPLAERIANWTESELRPLCSDEYEIQANWKLTAENFIDTYHVPVLHAQLSEGLSGGMPIEDIEISDDIIGVVMPEGYGEESGQTDWLLPRFPGLREDQQVRLEIFSIFPNTLLIVEPDCSQVIVLRPQSASATSETLRTTSSRMPRRRTHWRTSARRCADHPWKSTPRTRLCWRDCSCRVAWTSGATRSQSRSGTPLPNASSASGLASCSPVVDDAPCVDRFLPSGGDDESDLRDE